MTAARRPDVFVVGTDTGVGKSHASAALLHALARRHKRVCGMKPVAAGTFATPEGPANDDLLALRAASTIRVPPALDGPLLLSEPLSPHLAAAHAGVTIDIEHLAACLRGLQSLSDAVVVEGAGGFLVPLQGGPHGATGAELALAFELPLVLVVGLRLGCLNHALLTAEAIRARGLHLAGWIANRIDPHFACVDENIATLQERLQVPCWADLPHDPSLDARAASLHCADADLAAFTA